MHRDRQAKPSSASIAFHARSCRITHGVETMVAGSRVGMELGLLNCGSSAWHNGPESSLSLRTQSEPGQLWHTRPPRFLSERFFWPRLRFPPPTPTQESENDCILLCSQKGNLPCRRVLGWRSEAYNKKPGWSDTTVLQRAVSRSTGTGCESSRSAVMHGCASRPEVRRGERAVTHGVCCYRAVMLSHGTKQPARGLPPMPTPISLPSHTSGCGAPLLCKVPFVCPRLTGYGIRSRDRRPPPTRGETRPPPARGLMRWPCSSSSPNFRHRVVVISHCMALQLVVLSISRFRDFERGTAPIASRLVPDPAPLSTC